MEAGNIESDESGWLDLSSRPRLSDFYGLRCNSWFVGENLKLPVSLLLLSPQGFFPGKGAAAKLLPVQPIFPGKRDGTLIAVLLFKIRI